MKKIGELIYLKILEVKNCYFNKVWKKIVEKIFFKYFGKYLMGKICSLVFGWFIHV